jgi:hypothetical protein
LAEDAKFASAVRSTDPRFHARRRIVLAVILALLGLAVLIYGVVLQQTLIGLAGFALMLGAVVLGIQAFRRGRQPELKVVGGTAGPTGTKGTRRAPRGGRRSGILSRLEERWRNRPDQQG